MVHLTVKRKHAYYTVIHAVLQGKPLPIKKIIAFACNMEYYRSHEYENTWYSIHRNPFSFSSDRLCLPYDTGETFPAHSERTVIGHGKWRSRYDA